MKIVCALLSAFVSCHFSSCHPEWFDTNVFANLSNRWTHGVVPYVISRRYDLIEDFYIWRAMASYHRTTCLRFVERRDGDVDWVHFEGEDLGCFSRVGRVGGPQTVNLSPLGCMESGVILHEIMHVLGFFHEQSRRDRDDYVEVRFENIWEGLEDNFLKEPHNVNFPYDYDSILHYGQFAFSKNGRATIVPKRGGKLPQTPRSSYYFSENDFVKIRTIYNCTGHQAPPSYYIVALAILKIVR